MRFVFAIGAVISYFFLIVMLALRGSQHVLVRGSTELVFGPKEEKCIKVAIPLMYIQTFLFFLIFCHRNYGSGVWECIAYGLDACVVFTLMPPFCFFAIGMAVLLIINRKRKKRRAAALVEEQKPLP